MKDLLMLTLNKTTYSKIPKPKNDLDIYYAVGNAKTKRQESEIGAIINKRNYEG